MATKRHYRLKDKKIKLYSMVETTDELGQSVQQLALVDEIWAYYRQIGGSEYYELQKTNAKEDSMFCINYRTDIDAHSIIIYADRVYEVTRVDTYEGYRNDLYVYATWKKDKNVMEIEKAAVSPSDPEDPAPVTDPEEDPVDTDN